MRERGCGQWGLKHAELCVYVRRCEEDRLEEEHGRVALRDALGCEGVESRGGLLNPGCGGSRFMEKD